MAIESFNPPRFFYVWKGAFDDEAGEVSGIGTFELDIGPDGQARSGRGWFTVGHLDKLEFDIKSSVVLHRASAEDVRVMHGDDFTAKEALARKRYEA